MSSFIHDNGTFIAAILVLVIVAAMVLWPAKEEYEEQENSENDSE